MNCQDLLYIVRTAAGNGTLLQTETPPVFGLFIRLVRLRSLQFQPRADQAALLARADALAGNADLMDGGRLHHRCPHPRCALAWAAMAHGTADLAHPRASAPGGKHR